MDGADVVQEELEARQRELREVQARSSAINAPLRSQQTGIEALDAATTRMSRDLDRERKEVYEQERRLKHELAMLRKRTNQASSQDIISPRSARVGKRVLAFLLLFRIIATVWRRLLKGGRKNVSEFLYHDIKSKRIERLENIASYNQVSQLSSS